MKRMFLIVVAVLALAGCKGTNPRSAKDVMLKIGATSCKIIDYVCAFKDVVCGPVRDKAKKPAGK